MLGSFQTESFGFFCRAIAKPQNALWHYKQHHLKLIATFILSFIFSFCFAQTVTTETNFLEIRDVVLSENELYGIANDGRLLKWNLEEKIQENLAYDTTIKFTSIAVGKNSNIILGTNNGKLFELPKGKQKIILKRQLKKEVEVRQFEINSNNEIFLIVPRALYDPVKDKYWKNFIHHNRQLVGKKKFLFFFKKRTNKYFQMPQHTFIDNNDIIWMTSNYGEFGGSIQRFDTKNRKKINSSIDSLRLTMLFPQNIFSDDKNNIYISSGLQHFSNFGEIWKIRNNKAEKIFESKDFKEQYPDELFIGPCLIDTKEKNIYITTTEGVFKAELPLNGKIKKIDLLFEPEIYWDREPLAIGAKMSINKLLLTKDGKIIFLPSKNGVGIYANGKVKYLK